MRAADVIVKALEAQKLTRLYCVPGESYLPLLDALHDSKALTTIVCRHESGAGFMAVAEAKLTGRPACFMVSRGPGATNGSIALHVAEQDAVPVLMLVGQVSRDERGRGAFQEIDYGQFFGSIAKAVWEITDAEKVPEIMVRAFARAAYGTPGPVVVVLPEDVLDDKVTRPLPLPYPIFKPHAAASDVEAVAHALDQARRPLLIAGGMLRGDKGAAALADFARAQTVPVAASWKNQDIFDNGSPLYAGHLGVGTPKAHVDTLGRADLVIAAGTRLGDIASQNYTFPRAPDPEQPLIHIYPDTTPIGQVFRTTLGVIADPIELLSALARHRPRPEQERRAFAESIRSFVEPFSRFTSPEPTDGVDFGMVVQALEEAAPADAILITDAGNFSSWLHRHWRLTPRNRLLGMVAGAMGFAVPAAVAAALEAPSRMVIAIVGDGGVLMTGQELATAMQYGAKPKIVISDNGSYGTIRTHQERRFPRRKSATDLTNPDLTQWARSFGAEVFTIARGDDVRAKVKAALAADAATVIHVRSSLEAISAFTTVRRLRGE
jgi:acetolactate synthase I/II/III large subunit